MEPVPILQFFDRKVRYLSDHSEIEKFDEFGCNKVRIELLTKKKVRIELDDIQTEIDFWNYSVICYVIGANPPNHVMDGFIHRIWKSHGVDDRVAMIKKRV